MAWRPAKSLSTLKSQLDATYPGWLFLGFLGDQAHADKPSDHNPNAQGVVCALDIGPGGGLKIHTLADNIVASPHPDLKYIISNRRIAEWQYGFKWRPYSGSDPHDTHIHISVGRGPDGQSTQPYDDANNWNIRGGNMQDKATLEIVKRQFAAYWTPAQVASEAKAKGQTSDQWLQGWVGTGSHDLTNALFESPQFRNKRLDAEQNELLAKQSTGGYKPYDGPPLFLKP